MPSCLKILESLESKLLVTTRFEQGTFTPLSSLNRPLLCSRRLLLLASLLLLLSSPSAKNWLLWKEARQVWETQRQSNMLHRRLQMDVLHATEEAPYKPSEPSCEQRSSNPLVENPKLLTFNKTGQISNQTINLIFFRSPRKKDATWTLCVLLLAVATP